MGLKSWVKGWCHLDASLEWPDLLIDNSPGPLPDLRNCLEQISQTAPALVQDNRYQELDLLCRQRSY